MRPANLLPPDLAGTRRALPKTTIGALGAGAAVGLLIAGAFVVEHGKVSDRERKLATLQNELAAIPPRQAPAVTISPELKAEEGARLAALDQALSEQISWDSVLRELSLVLPEDVWLSTLSAKAPGAAAATETPTPAAGGAAATTAPQGLLLNGYTYSQEGVARLLTRLSLVPHLANVQLQSSTASQLGNRSIVGFTIAAEIRPTGGETR